MALYDGFFDATLNEETYQYDREYNSGDFTEYFASSIGSGVCIYNNISSMKVSWDGTAAVVAPGYLFIEGYWLKNDGNYSVPLSEAGAHAILAYLNTGARRIEIISQLKADPEEYPSCLCLAYVTIDGAGTGTVEDTRYNTDICGVIDSAGDLSVKVEYAINYIDNEVEGKLAEAEAAIEAQAVLLDAKIEEVNQQVEKLTPPPIGTVKFSASSAIEEGWLRCDGSFISETDYPELVAALGKKYPSGDKFALLSDGEIGQNISNMVLYEGRLWVYSYSEKKLYGVSVDGSGTVSIPVTSEYTYFDTFLSPTSDQPIVLSIVPHKVGTGTRLFLAQIIAEGTLASASPLVGVEEKLLLFSGEFTGSESELALTMPVASITRENYGSSNYYVPDFGKKYVPYVISQLINGAEVFNCMCCERYITSGTSNSGGTLRWSDESTTATLTAFYMGQTNTSNNFLRTAYQRYGFSPNNKGESVAVAAQQSSSYPSYTVYSGVDGLFSAVLYTSTFATGTTRSAFLPLAVAGTPAVIYDIQVDGFVAARLDKTSHTFVSHGISLPTASRVFYDAGCYLEGKDIYMIFMGTGILFSRELTAGDVGYLDTTSVLGTITQYGHLLHSQDENTLYLIGQDTSNKVKVAKMVLNTLFDYANDGAWLPLVASDGVPAYIKAYEPEEA